MAEGINAQISDKVANLQGMGEEMEVDLASLAQHYTSKLDSRRVLFIGNGEEVTAPESKGKFLYDEKHLELCLEHTEERIELPDKGIDLMNEGDHFNKVIKVMATLTMRFIYYLAREISAIVHADEKQLPNSEDTWAVANTDAFEECKKNQALIEGPANLLLIEDGHTHADTDAHGATSPVQSLADAIVGFYQANSKAIRDYREHSGRRALQDGEFTKLKVIQYCMITPQFARVCYAMLVVLELDAYGLCLLGLLNPHAPISHTYKDLASIYPLQAPTFIEDILNTNVLDAETWAKVKATKQKDVGLLNLNPEEADLTSDTAFTVVDYEEAGEQDVPRLADFDTSDNYIEDFKMLLALVFYCKIARDLHHRKGKDAEGIVKALIEEATDPEAASFVFEAGKRIDKELFDNAVAALLRAWLSVDDDKQAILREQFAAMEAPTVMLGVIEEVNV